MLRRKFLVPYPVSTGFEIQWMVQAGGAGGGRTSGYGANSAGGGAGGFRSSVTNSGGGVAAEAAVTGVTGDVITVTVGGGGGTNDRYGGRGGQGAVRVIWGDGRAFPNTNTNQANSFGNVSNY